MESGLFPRVRAERVAQRVATDSTAHARPRYRRCRWLSSSSFGWNDFMSVAAHSSQNFHRTVPDLSPTVITLRERTVSLCWPHLWHFVMSYGSGASCSDGNRICVTLRSASVMIQISRSGFPGVL